MIDHKLIKQKLQNINILYVEDEDNVRVQIYEFLQRYCNTVLTAKSAEEAYELYDSNKVNIMIVDIDLPKMNGIELIKKIRKKDLDTRILILTAYIDSNFILQAIELNLTKYLTKPVVGNELLDAILKCLSELNNEQETIDLGNGFRFDLDKKVLFNNTQEVMLRKKELQLLEFFIINKDKIITYNELETQIWFDTVMSQNAIRSQIKNLRQKHTLILLKTLVA